MGILQMLEGVVNIYEYWLIGKQVVEIELTMI